MKALAGNAAAVLARMGVIAALEMADRRRDRIRILAYHRIDDPEAEPDLDPGLVSATPSEFRAQLEVLSRHYNVVSLDRLVASQRGDAELPPRAVLITFDDGYLDFESHAWPLLSEFGLPAVVFVPTSFPDTQSPGFWWDRLHSAVLHTKESEIDVAELGTLPLGDAQQRRASLLSMRAHAKTLLHQQALAWVEALIARLAAVPNTHRVLGWDALRKLADDGASVCSHGNLHALCTRLAPADLVQDLAVSKARIEDELGASAPAPVIAYPAGDCDGAVKSAVRDAGYLLGFGGVRGVDRVPAREPFELLRLPVQRYGTALFRAQLRPSVARLGRAFIDRAPGRLAS